MGLQVGVSVQEENASIMGVEVSGRINKDKRKEIFSKIVQAISGLGFSDIMSNPKHGTVNIPSATSRDKVSIRMALLSLERSLGGMGLLAPSSTYHRFAVGMTGDKMSSSKPKTTLFLSDDVATAEKKIKKSYSGGQATVEEHRRLGGDPDKDVAYQYMMYFFEEDDKFLSEINEGYRSGKILAGEMKQLCIERATEWLTDLSEKRDETAHLIEKFFE
jgi:tryptophanyl-tRNA synthetase